MTAHGGGEAGSSRARLSVDAPAPGVYRIRVHGHLGLLAGVRLLRLLDARLTAGAAACGARTDQVLVDLTGVVGADHGGLRVLGRAAEVAAHHRSRLVLVSPDGGAAWCPAWDRRHLTGLETVGSVAEAVGPVRDGTADGASMRPWSSRAGR